MRPTKRIYGFGFAVLVAATASVFIWRANAQTVINAGYDQFSTPNNAATQGSLSLPAGALTDAAGSPSLALNDAPVTYQGGTNVQGYNGDTVVERTANVTVPGTTPLLVIGLNLVSTGTVQVQFQDGTSANYSVSVAQSPSTRSQGSMTFNNGGTFSSSLGVNVQYTLTAPGEPQAIIDAAKIGLPAIDLSATGTWQAGGGGSDEVGGPGLAAISSSGGVIIRPGTHMAPNHAHNIIPAPSPTPKPTTTAIPFKEHQ